MAEWACLGGTERKDKLLPRTHQHQCTQMAIFDNELTAQSSPTLTWEWTQTPFIQGHH